MPEPDWVDALDGDYLYAHVASPDVHIDDSNQRLVMYYHGLLPGGDQQTRLATSTDGINFKPREPLLEPPYFRATRLDGMIYLLMWEGRLGRTRSWEGPIDVAPKELLPDDITGAHRVGPKPAWLTALRGSLNSPHCYGPGTKVADGKGGEFVGIRVVAVDGQFWTFCLCANEEVLLTYRTEIEQRRHLRHRLEGGTSWSSGRVR
ncbi:MAG: hypothetical protein MK312_10695, partial [Roseibacillus sp.]|nr:hypothetical protein [Roseibacillus sp.]